MKAKGIVKQLEPRLLMSADLAPVPDSLHVTPADSEPETVLLSTLTRQDSRAAPIPAASQAWAHERRELVVVDTATPHFQTVVDRILADGNARIEYEVVLLDATQDGIEQVTELLSVDHGLDALHLLNTAEPGSITLAGTRLSAQDLHASKDTIALWSTAFNDGAELRLHGPGQAAGPGSQGLIDASAPDKAGQAA